MEFQDYKKEGYTTLLSVRISFYILNKPKRQDFHGCE